MDITAELQGLCRAGGVGVGSYFVLALAVKPQPNTIPYVLMVC